ncbi:methyl-accepting chemotaxis protein [Fontibacillus phaseoli]|uniref:Methyl-accepting chemotaxis protein n=1 Tax=Fontibacillus phaseoli TaxID=1416533 RepID=A0A369B8R7_9BACL|nr:methyl-accepting chemotaxis protein [Fontibacillus phaseoli]RCX17811.1 methyl-accepting chemotaxis protein [Fontibacillus phaseoli]
MRNRSIGTKIILIVVNILLAFAVVTAIVAVNQMKKGIESFATAKAKSDLELARQWLDSQYPGDWEIREGQLFKGDTKMNDNKEVVDQIGQATEDTVTIFQQNKRVATNVMDGGQRAVGTTVSDKVAEVVLKQGEKYYGKAVVLGKNYQAAYEPIKNSSGETIGIFYVGASQHLIQSIQQDFMTTFAIVFVVAMLVACVVVVWYIKRMQRRLMAVTQAMELAGTGDFTAIIQDKSGDEIGRLGGSFNRMGESLKALILQGLLASEKVAASTERLKAVAEKTTEESFRIAESMEQVTEGADNQTQSTAENARAVEEISVGVQNIAEHALEVSESAVRSKGQADTGASHVRQTLQQINSISLSVQETDRTIQRLDEKSREIEEILGLIREISAQTNLLALNASIEAARAGDQGRGFAIVASEVRKLAEQSETSSHRISEVIREIGEDVKISLGAMETVMQKVTGGLELAKETDRSFAGIVESNGRIAEQMEHLAATSEQMSAGIEEITASVTVISEIARATSSNSRQVTQSASTQLDAFRELNDSAVLLSEVSGELHQALAKFKING